MIDVVDKVFQRGVLRHRADQHRIDPDHTAAPGHRAHLRICAVAIDVKEAARVGV